MAPEKPSTLGSNLRAAAGEALTVAQETVPLMPLGIHPLGAAVTTGGLLGGLSVVGMRLYERERDRRLGTPQERAERAYGAGIEARIRRKQAAGRKFK